MKEFIVRQYEIGEVFEYEGKKLKCCKGSCSDCVFKDASLSTCHEFLCCNEEREDDTCVHFEELKDPEKKQYKIGEVFEHDGEKLVCCAGGCCEDCIFYVKSLEFCKQIVCKSDERTDKKDITFQKVVAPTSSPDPVKSSLEERVKDLEDKYSRLESLCTSAIDFMKSIDEHDDGERQRDYEVWKDFEKQIDW